MDRVVVIGGGISGLAAAYRLQQERPAAEVVLVEREPVLGGKVRTEYVDGFVVEGGPDSFLTSKPAGLALCRELGIENALEGTRPELRHTFVLHNNRLYEMPQGLSGLVPARLGPLFRSPLFSPLGKARLALEALVPGYQGETDESLGAFMVRRFGGEAYERLIEALMSGIYGGNGEALSLLATFPQLRSMEQRHGSLLLGMRAARRERPAGAARPAFVAPVSGMATLIDALAAALRPGTARTAVAETICPRGSGYAVTLDDGVLAADAVILATPSSAAAELLGSLDSELAALLRAIPYASTATISLAFKQDAIPPLSGYGYIVPRAERRAILACTWTSSKFAHRAPPGYALLRLFVGRAGEDAVLDRSDADLVDLARQELATTLRLDAVPLWSRIFRWQHGMPQYTVGHVARLDAIERRLAEHPGLFVAGAAYRGVGIPDCIASGERAAEMVITRLESVAARPPA